MQSTKTPDASKCISARVLDLLNVSKPEEEGASSTEFINFYDPKTHKVSEGFIDSDFLNDHLDSEAIVVCSRCTLSYHCTHCLPLAGDRVIRYRCHACSLINRAGNFNSFKIDQNWIIQLRGFVSEPFAVSLESSATEDMLYSREELSKATETADHHPSDVFSDVVIAVDTRQYCYRILYGWPILEAAVARAKEEGGGALVDVSIPTVLLLPNMSPEHLKKIVADLRFKTIQVRQKMAPQHALCAAIASLVDGYSLPDLDVARDRSQTFAEKREVKKYFVTCLGLSEALKQALMSCTIDLLRTAQLREGFLDALFPDSCLTKVEPLQKLHRVGKDTFKAIEEEGAILPADVPRQQRIQFTEEMTLCFYSVLGRFERQIRGKYRFPSVSCQCRQVYEGLWALSLLFTFVYRHSPKSGVFITTEKARSQFTITVFVGEKDNKTEDLNLLKWGHEHLNDENIRILEADEGYCVIVIACSPSSSRLLVNKIPSNFRLSNRSKQSCVRYNERSVSKTLVIESTNASTTQEDADIDCGPSLSDLEEENEEVTLDGVVKAVRIAWDDHRGPMFNSLVAFARRHYRDRDIEPDDDVKVRVFKCFYKLLSAKEKHEIDKYIPRKREQCSSSEQPSSSRRRLD